MQRTYFSAMTARLSRLPLFCAVLTAVLWLVDGPGWLSQGVAVAVLVATVLGLSRLSGPGRMVLATPLFLLGAVAIVFYGLVPGWGEPFFQRYGMSPSVQYYRHYLDLYPGGSAERLILRFGATLLTLATFLSRRNGTMIAPASTQGHLSAALPVGSGLVVVAGLGVALIPQLANDQVFWRSMFGVLPALVSFGLMLVVFNIRPGNWRDLLLLGGLCAITMIVSVHVGLGKQPVAILLMVTLVTTIRLRLPLLRSTLVGIVGAGVILTAVLPRHTSIGSGATKLLNEVTFMVEYKIWVRQLQTCACFQSALDQHADVQPAQPWHYFLSALVPRVLWPEKPRVSDGAGYSQRYCGIPYDMPTHSAAVTLLGEPMIMAGHSGLVASVLVLIAVLGTVSIVLIRGGPLSAAAAAASTPWLIDFDQHYAMYLANVAKFALCMLPFCLIVWGVSRGAQSVKGGD